MAKGKTKCLRDHWLIRSMPHRGLARCIVVDPFHAHWAWRVVSRSGSARNLPQSSGPVASCARTRPSSTSVPTGGFREAIKATIVLPPRALGRVPRSTSVPNGSREAIKAGGHLWIL